MPHKYILYFCLLFVGIYIPSYGQNTNCGPEETVDSSGFTGTAFFNYGSSVRVKSQKYQTSVACGQTFVGFVENSEFSTNVGFFTRFLLPPFELSVIATQGDLLDRIQLTWEIDALGPQSTEGFNIYRDDIFLATVAPEIRNYNDFNVIAGKAYIYSVRGVNAFGEGANSEALGFQVPNGVVTGWVRSLNDSPVPDALVTLMPMQGFSAKFGVLDGATAIADNTDPFLPENEDWTLAFWMKTDSISNNENIISFGSQGAQIKATNDGLEVLPNSVGPAFLSATFPDSTANTWHHVALTFDNGSSIGRIYLDGILKDQHEMTQVPLVDSLRLGSVGGSNGWAGRLDEIRIYHTQLNELDFVEVMKGTASSNTPNLNFYWKLDEELGVKSYDIIKRHKLFFCGAVFDKDRPTVRTSGKTNEYGYYRIESASYGTGTTFLASPAKSFYLHKSLDLNSEEMDYLEFPDFSLTKKSTIEVWVNNASAIGNQTILSKKWGSNEFRLFIEPNGLDNQLMVELNGTSYDYGNLGTGFQHLALTIDSLSGQVDFYHNGILTGSNIYAGITGNWSEEGKSWIVGAKLDGVSTSEHFNGLVNEFAVYDTTLTQSAILEHFETSRNMQEPGLRVYFPCDEGNGTRLTNVGSLLLEYGEIKGAEWSAFAPNQVVEPHDFTPATRQVTLNPSVTSVDQVDFVDRSTIPVSGFVRYKNTDCFAQNVEILVNGASFSPKIFTDSTGRFLIDFDPGSTARLEPKFEDHTFVPAFWDVANVNSPIAGIIFNDVTTRKVSGQVAGGFCKKSIIKAPPGTGQGTVCVVRVRTVDGCLERIITIDNQDGTFEFDNLPPVEKMTVAVVEHSDPEIKTAFQVLGGSTVDLTKKDTIIDFIYFAPPEVEIVSGLEPFSPSCDLIVMDQGDQQQILIKLKEQYEPTPSDDGVCYVDTANIRIINGFADETKDTTLSNGLVVYEYKVGTPNPSPPFLKTLQVIGTTLTDRESSITRQGIVTGIRNKENTFTSTLPTMPSVILRDPPGDGSSAFMEKGQKICKTTSMSLEFEEGGGQGLELHLGPTVTIGTGLLVITINEFGPIAEFGVSGDFSFKQIDNSSFETCLSFNEKISTDTSDKIIGRDADVYMGDATNIIFGFADLVTFNDTICEATTEVVLNVEPGNFQTTYIYSGFQIKNYLIPNLDLLAEAEADSATRADYLTSSQRWKDIIEVNETLKDSAALKRNISFDAGIQYEYSETSDTINTTSVEDSHAGGLATTVKAGFEFNDFGFTGSLNYFFKTASGTKSEEGVSKGLTTGYTLSDDDPGDAFSVDIAMDPVFNTPVFRLKAGQSSCPWEEDTANREAPNMQLAPGSQFVATNIPANEPAVFQFQLGNLSATNEDWTYGFSAIAGSNPNGAIIKLNGQPLNYTERYIVPYGSSQLVTLTVEKGPIEYDYDSLLIAMYSECEFERNLALGLPLDSNAKFFSPIYIGAHFIRPCSEVNVNVPEQDWVLFPDPLTPGEDDIRRITVSDYDTSVVDFQLVRVQYRRSDGDGAWINIPGLSDRYNPNWAGYDTFPDPKPEVLQPNFTQYFWDTEGLSDGPYEIRAVAICTGDATDMPGYSQIIKGRIDREPPSLVGVPQPSDGVFNVGDEISFTFNQDVNCNKVTSNPDHVGLYDTTTGSLINYLATCVGNKIVIDPIFQNEGFENKILRAELHNIQDLTGNNLIFEKWEFYVDRNELAWLTDSIELTKYSDETKTITAKIHNRGGYPVPYTMIDYPEWVHVSPNSGTLVANEIEEINFTVDENVPLGYLSDSIVMHTEIGENPFFMGGDEILNLTARVICRPDEWILNPENFNASEYSFSMNFNLSLNIEGVLSTDIEDIVGAYVGDELRGVSRIQYNSQLDAYLAFITVYSNVASGETVEFQIWDASECKLFAPILESHPFGANDIVGSALDPLILNTSGKVLRKIFIHPGWNWISMNLEQEDPAINEVLQSLSNPSGALIKGQTEFSAYSDVLETFVGSLDSISSIDLYQYNSLAYDSISLVGTLIDPATEIPVNSGWNWIGYVPNEKLPIELALSSLTPTEGDLIKSQVSFAQYVNNVGWIGNLDFMDAPNGYLLKLANPDVLVYPNPLGFKNDPNGSEALKYFNQSKHSNNIASTRSANHWQVDASQFEHSMNAIAIVVKNDDEYILDDNDEVAAFVGDEVRGAANAIYIPAIDAYMLFMTIYANQEGELLTFQFYDSSEGKEFEIMESSGFVINQVLGEVDNPEFWNLNLSTGLTDLNGNEGITVFPNPFSNSININFQIHQIDDVEVIFTDVYGALVEKRTVAAKQGMNVVEWIPNTEVLPGTYFVTLKDANSTYVHKILYIK